MRKSVLLIGFLFITIGIFAQNAIKIDVDEEWKNIVDERIEAEMQKQAEKKTSEKISCKTFDFGAELYRDVCFYPAEESAITLIDIWHGKKGYAPLKENTSQIIFDKHFVPRWGKWSVGLYSFMETRFSKGKDCGPRIFNFADIDIVGPETDLWVITNIEKNTLFIVKKKDIDKIIKKIEIFAEIERFKYFESKKDADGAWLDAMETMDERIAREGRRAPKDSKLLEKIK